MFFFLFFGGFVVLSFVFVLYDIYVSTRAHTYVHKHITDMHIHTHVQVHARTHTDMYMHADRFIHTHTYRHVHTHTHCLLYTSPSPRDLIESRMPSSA